MPLYIKDDATAQLVTQSCEAARHFETRLAVQAELDRAAEAIPLRDRFAALRTAHALPQRTDKTADKAFFDELSGGL